MTQTNNTQTKRSFNRDQPTSIVINDILGEEAKKYALETYEYLGKQVYMNNRKPHSHAWGAFCRRHFNEMLVEGILKGRSILDVAASVNRNYSKGWTNVWSVCALSDGMAQYRDIAFRDQHFNVTEAELYSRVCRCYLEGKPINNNCMCQHGYFDNVIAVDAVYEYGVLDELLYRTRKSGRPAYFTMFDYDKVRRSGKVVARGFDNELSVTFEGGFAVNEVKGNPTPYRNRILNTHKQSWQFKNSTGYFVFEITHTLQHGDLDYVLVKLTPMRSLPIVGIHEVKELFYKPAQQVIQIGPGQEIDPRLKEAEKLFTKAFGSNLASMKFDGEEVILTVKENHSWWNFEFATHLPFIGEVAWQRKKSVFKANLGEVFELVPKFVGRYTSSDIQKNIRSYISETVKTTTNVTAHKLERLRDTAVLAMHVSATVAGGVLDFANESVAVSKYKLAVAGSKLPTLSFDWEKFVGRVIKASALLLVIFAIMRIPSAMAQSMDGGSDGVNDLTLAMIVSLLFCGLSSIKVDFKQLKRAELKGSCVFDKERLKLPDPSKVRYDPMFKFVDDKWHPDKIECDAKERPSAYQIAPLFSFDGAANPTVKHPCRKVALAASIRATSNQVYYDKAIVEDWCDWFRKTIIPEFTDALSCDEIEVTMDDWLSKYPVKYREQMIREAQKNWEDETHFTYDSFPKVELQYTEVHEHDRETTLNTVKERQISGPPAAKKLMANAVINGLEKLAHRHISNYCGMKDWPGICKTIEEQMEFSHDIVFGAADGSGFDMTQFPAMHAMVDELIAACLKHPNFKLADPFTKEMVLVALRDSHILNVSVGRGAVKYRAQGRASGDGWTTFGNTVLMMSYWKYTLHKAGIRRYLLLVKGDDVLLAVRRKDIQILQLMVSRYFLTKQESKAFGLGQICKFIKWGEIEDMDFLSCYFFVGNDGHLRMTRIPARVIQTISWSTKIPIFCKDMNLAAQELAYSKGHSLLAWSRGLPIWEVLANKLIELGRPGALTEFNQYSDGGRVWGDVDDREAYASFLTARFGLCCSSIARIEDRIRRISNLLEVVEIPEFALFIGA